MSRLKYVTIKDIEQYVKQFGRMDSEQQLVHMVNWFAEGAITTLSNTIVENGGELQYGPAIGCRCGSCFEWQILCDGELILCAEDLAGFLKDSE